MGEMTIVIPMAPPRELLPNNRRNGRSHWSVQSEATAELRTAAKGAALNAIAANQATVATVPVIVSYAVVWPYAWYKDKLRIPDHDAIPTAAKAILDALVDANILADDSGEYVAEVRAKGRRGVKGEDGVTVETITAAAESEVAA